MKLTLVWAVALLCVASYMEVEAFKWPADLNMNHLKDKFEEMKNSVMNHLRGKNHTMEKLSGDVSKNVMEKIESMTKTKVRDPEALKSFVNHLVHVQATMMLKHHEVVSKSMITEVKNVAKKYDIKISANMDFQKLMRSMTNFTAHQMFTYGTEFHLFLTKHEINLKSGTHQEAMHMMLKAVATGKNTPTAMFNILSKYTATSIPAAKQANIQKMLEETVNRLYSGTTAQMQKVLVAHGINMPTAGTKQLMSHMIIMGCKKPKPMSVENSLSTGFNHAMEMMRKAFGSMDSEKTHVMMETMKKMMPHILEHHVREMRKKMATGGKPPMSWQDLMNKIREHSKAKMEQDEKDSERRHHNHHHRHHRHHGHQTKKILMAVLIPLGVVLLIALVSVLVYYLIKSNKNKKEEEFDDIQKPPSKKVNPYAHLHEPYIPTETKA